MLQQALQLLKRFYGYNEFRPGQEKIILSLLEGKDTVAIMPTGAGKSICFQIPALLLPGVTLVISPLISLMKDQVDALNMQGIPATYINSSLTSAELSRRLYDIGSNHYKLIYIAPERLSTEAFQSILNKLTVSMVAVDEAHCLSQWGHDFRPSYQAIFPFINTLPTKPLISAFTATATLEVKEDIHTLLGLHRPEIYVTGFDRPNLYFSILRGENKQKFILNYIKNHADQSGIIYAATRKDVDGLYELLLNKGYQAGHYHAGLRDDERIHQQEQFLYDKIQVMVATNAFGMGIDKSNVRFVIHYNMPKNMEAYYQEAGRSGRDGEPGECILLFSSQDIMLQKFLIDKSVENPDRKQHELGKLQAMVDYCHTPNCLRQYILQYFGETSAKNECDHCSNCKNDSELIDITIDAQKVFSCVYRLRERFGVTMIADVLKGSKNKKVLQFKFDQLPTYGLFSNRSVDEIKSLIQRLTATQYLALTESEYPVVKLTETAFAVLKNEASVWQKVVKTHKAQADDTVFTALRKLRRTIAEEENIPPYLVFADSTLREMSAQLPRTMDDLQQIKGIGEVKQKKYGAQFLNLLKEFAPSAPPETKEKKVQPEKKSDKQPTHLITLQMFADGLSLEEIGQTRDLKPVTLQNHLVKAAEEGHPVDWDRLIPAGQESRIIAVIDELGTDKLRPIKDALPEEIGYDTIKAVIAKHFS
ncbi:DNA helicase RecQ [Anaerosinus massiliensis]|uniref:DNA helicase RecQ n=1 Tax=Massilibacillus massiliensis TaxID=1806837 RepID=UPI000A737621|nr:DNA helicase RecQ [Massilibacillus massiliensis]